MMSWQENKGNPQRSKTVKCIIFDLEIPLVEIYSTFTCYRSIKSYMGRINEFKSFLRLG